MEIKTITFGSCRGCKKDLKKTQRGERERERERGGGGVVKVSPMYYVLIPPSLLTVHVLLGQLQCTVFLTSKKDCVYFRLPVQDKQQFKYITKFHLLNSSFTSPLPFSFLDVQVQECKVYVVLLPHVFN